MSIEQFNKGAYIEYISDPENFGTTDETPSTAVSISIDSGLLLHVFVKYMMNDVSASTTGQAAAGTIEGFFRKTSGGSMISIGAPVSTVIHNFGSEPIVSLAPNGGDLDVVVTGFSSKTLFWRFKLDYFTDF